MATAEQIQLVRESWSEVDIPEAGRTFYKRFFELEPEAVSLFRLGGECPLTSLKMAKQGEVTFNFIKQAVGLLHDTEALLEELDDLGERHTRYGTTRAHFRPAGEALLYTLEQQTGEKWTEATKQAWVAVYGIITDRMCAKLP